MPELGVNIDHVATVRQARRESQPDPVRAAAEAEAGGADLITAHLREDRRHIQDHDIERLRRSVATRLNLEMAATDEMVSIALRVRPDMVTLVPEGRLEITTEGGLDVLGESKRLREVVGALKAEEILTSAFIDPNIDQADAAADVGFDACEIHTGPYAHAKDPAAELAKVEAASRQIIDAGLRFNAGHALDYDNTAPVAAMADLWQLHIGHAIVSRALFTGLREAVAQMKRLINE
ncbi:MAG: pyridoxine 5'-phosphate synthase [Phycisphaeraceae bacterium]|nr:pyridoxine 5'-phosphate synthase [Phycisphaeraceae bacterium]